MRLVRVELRRLWARRLVRWTLWNAVVVVRGTFEAGGDVPNRTVTARP